MKKPQFQEKSTNTFDQLPKPGQLALLQRYRNRHVSRKEFTTENEDVISNMAENFFIKNVLNFGLGEEWMIAIYNGNV